MITVPFHLRILSLLATASLNLIRADPRGFLGKLSERIRQAGFPGATQMSAILRHGARGNSTEARKLIDAGHFTAGISLVLERRTAASHAELHLARRTAERLLQLHRSPEEGVALASLTHPRVLHVLTNSQPFTNSGYPVRSQHVLECQRDVGIEVEGVTRLGYPVLVGKLPRTSQQTLNGITYRRLLPWAYPMSLPEREKQAIEMIVDAAKDFGATALHTTTDYTNALVVSEAAKRLSIPWVYEVRGELESTWLARQPQHHQAQAEESEFYRLARAQETACMLAASAVVSLSEVSKRQMIERGVPAEKITVVPNAVDEDLIGREFDQAEIRREFNLPLDKMLVGTVTAVVDYEGLGTLIDALTLLEDDWQVLVVGDGTALPELKAQAQRLGVADRCRFVGRKPAEDIWKWYAALDVFAVPREDTRVTRVVTPIKPLIAMALGVPVVASDLPALREATGGGAGYVQAGNGQALAEAIRDRANTSPTAYSDFLRSRTWSSNGQRYLSL